LAQAVLLPFDPVGAKAKRGNLHVEQERILCVYLFKLGEAAARRDGSASIVFLRRRRRWRWWW
jgi:hypothetical protein